MFDDIIKKPDKRIFLFHSEINPVVFSKGFKIWGQKEVILCRNKTEQGLMVMGQQQEEV